MSGEYRKGTLAVGALLLLSAGCVHTAHVPPPPILAREQVPESPINWSLSPTLPTAEVPPPPNLFDIARANLARGDRAAAREIYEQFIATNPPGKDRDQAIYSLAVLQGLGRQYAAAQESLRELRTEAEGDTRSAADLLGRLIEERSQLEKQKQEQRELADKLDRQVRSLKRNIDEKNRTIEERERALEEKERSLQEAIEKLKHLILDPPS